LNIVKKYNETSLIIRIACGLAIGVILGLFFPHLVGLRTLGELFVGALKSIAPILVFFLVCSALLNGNGKLDKKFGTVVFFYLTSTFLAACVAVGASVLFPQKIVLMKSAEKLPSAPSGIADVINQ
jgi:serine/threonine transporter